MPHRAARRALLDGDGAVGYSLPKTGGQVIPLWRRTPICRHAILRSDPAPVLGAAIGSLDPQCLQGTHLNGLTDHRFLVREHRLRVIEPDISFVIEVEYVGCDGRAPAVPAAAHLVHGHLHSNSS
jgi:hypothetical protein